MDYTAHSPEYAKRSSVKITCMKSVCECSNYVQSLFMNRLQSWLSKAKSPILSHSGSHTQRPDMHIPFPELEQIVHLLSIFRPLNLSTLHECGMQALLTNFGRQVPALESHNSSSTTFMVAATQRNGRVAGLAAYIDVPLSFSQWSLPCKISAFLFECTAFFVAVLASSRRFESQRKCIKIYNVWASW